jgi:N-methylhydantoinase B
VITDPVSSVDPITFEVVRGGLLTTAGEIKAGVMHSAMSPIVALGADLSCGVADATGRLVAQGQDIPAQLGALPMSIRATLDAMAGVDFEEGDAVISNDVYTMGANHLNDVLMIYPVFVDGSIVAYSAARSHWSDIGGVSAGSVNPAINEIYADGLRIPAIRLFRAGVLQEELASLILLNVRNPRERRWDMFAQYAGCRTGARSVERLCRKYGSDVVSQCMDKLLDYSERRLREGVKGLPDGEYSAEDWLDGDGIEERPVRLAAKVTVKGEDLSIDFEGSSPQVKGGMNAAWAATWGMAHYVVKGVIDYRIPSNEGCYRAVRVTSPKGTIVNPIEPAAAATGGLSETVNRVVDLLLMCFTQADPSRTPAGSMGTSGILAFRGPEKSEERRWYLGRRMAMESLTQRGGYGARSRLDGINGIGGHLGNTSHASMEVFESGVPVRVKRWEIMADSGGAGRQRGGCGLEYEYEVLGDDYELLSMAGRGHVPAAGFHGGRAGSRTSFNLKEPGSEWRSLGLLQPGLPITAGTVVNWKMPSGGGFGPPWERDPDAVLADVLDGYVSVAAAESDYGVVVGPDGTIDAAATAERRRVMALEPVAVVERGDITWTPRGPNGPPPDRSPGSS